jgi:prolyl-tRNA synthetase
MSRCFIPTLKEDPAEAEVISHRLLVRAGMIRKLTSGIYSFLPTGLRSLNKVAEIVREEMDRSGCLEVLMPMVQPADLWQETGRWDVYGKELLRLKDRHQRDCCLGPTHEEVITDILRGEVRSYRQLPLNLYQIQTKFRDEIRPRFGLMRCREFIMKDGYSFDRDEQGAAESYQNMFEAYIRIFKRLGLQFRSVEADSGPIGGNLSHEFMVLADTGEDTIAVCNSCEYAANLEKAEVLPRKPGVEKTECPEAELVDTPEAHTVEKIATFLGVSKDKVVKTMLYEADGRPVAGLVRGDRELNEVKFKNALGATDLELASAEKIEKWTGAPVGFAGPKDLKIETVLADNELRNETDWVTGANQADAHYVHIDLDRDANISKYLDLSVVNENDPCPKCSGSLQFTKGIEVGHVFNLGKKYSHSMQATFLDEQGKEQEMIMGCYGIGVSRVVAAAIEQNHDQNGIIFPPAVSPYEVIVLALNPKDEQVLKESERIYQSIFEQGADVILDDRKERPGFKFKDADLLGFSMQLIVGAKGIQNGIVEAKDRRSGERKELSLENFAQEFGTWREEVWQGWMSGSR